ncbi:Conserved_hypothetical protein [Hexamita inflata]|uniref:Uncharacterized protein n=1 Tax=Hexamita inflata TaxID=28002 RepID=A0AA86PJZ7_9EUKA|nr:Conserved hypothetical protein [Hexamita inflata]
MRDLPSFALFGLSSTVQLVKSNIAVSVLQDLAQCSLVCFTCDVNATLTDFSFVGSAQNISGLVLTPKTAIQLQQSLVQVRLYGVNVGGLVLNASQMAVTLAECNVSCYSQGSVNGTIIAYIFDGVILEVDNFKICSNVQNFGQGVAAQTGQITAACDICRNATYAYGLCLEILQYGETVDNKIQCKISFVFDGKQCSCPNGYAVNESLCVNILEAINKLIQTKLPLESKLQDLNKSVKELENQAEIMKGDQDQMQLDILSLYSLSNQTQANIENNSSLLQFYISGNFTNIAENLYNSTVVLDQRIFQNATNLNFSISTLGEYSSGLNQNITLMNQTILNQKERSAQLKQNISALNQTILSSNEVIQQQKKLITNLSLLVQCLNNANYANLSGKCYVVNQKDDSALCSQKVYVSSFDVAAVAQYVISSDNFSSGYVFTTIVVVQDAFIDVSDNVYSTTLYPLFQAQNGFTNLKIQFGTETLNTGSLIQAQAAIITINQVNIISKSGSQLTVSPASQLNILSASPTGASITNLLVNLSFAFSNGNITLVGVVSGTFSMNGYQVLGSYTCTQKVAMIGLKATTATVNLIQISFRPSAYQVGNGSSYLFGGDGSTVCTFVIYNLAIILGSGSNFLGLSSLSSSQLNMYLFGGIVAYIEEASSVSVNNVVLDSYQQVSTEYVKHSGFLVGYLQSSSSCVSLVNVCLQQNMTSTTKEFWYFGLVGNSRGITLVNNASISFSVQGVYLNGFGIIGLQQNAVKAEVVNVRTTFTLSPSGGGFMGAVFGQSAAQNSSILNTTVVGSFSSGSTVGGFIGFYGTLSNLTIVDSIVNANVSASGQNVGGFIGQQNSNVFIISSTVQSANVSSAGQNIGGFIGQCSLQFYLTSSKIIYTRISGYSNVGVVVGVIEGGTYSFTNSFSNQNFVNGELQTDCGTLSNSWSVSGC